MVPLGGWLIVGARRGLRARLGAASQQKRYRQHRREQPSLHEARVGLVDTCSGWQLLAASASGGASGASCRAVGPDADGGSARYRVTCERRPCGRSRRDCRSRTIATTAPMMSVAPATASPAVRGLGRPAAPLRSTAPTARSSSPPRTAKPTATTSSWRDFRAAPRKPPSRPAAAIAVSASTATWKSPAGTPRSSPSRLRAPISQLSLPPAGRHPPARSGHTAIHARPMSSTVPNVSSRRGTANDLSTTRGAQGAALNEGR